MLWNDRRTPPGQLTDASVAAKPKRGFASAHESMKRTAAAQASGPVKPTRTEAAHSFMKNAAEASTSGKQRPAKINKARRVGK